MTHPILSDDSSLVAMQHNRKPCLQQQSVEISYVFSQRFESIVSITAPHVSMLTSSFLDPPAEESPCRRKHASARGELR